MFTCWGINMLATIRTSVQAECVKTSCQFGWSGSNKQLADQSVWPVSGGDVAVPNNATYSLQYHLHHIAKQEALFGSKNNLKPYRFCISHQEYFGRPLFTSQYTGLATLKTRFVFFKRQLATFWKCKICKARATSHFIAGPQSVLYPSPCNERLWKRKCIITFLRFIYIHIKYVQYKN